jgi:DNA polymerase-1
MSDLFSSRVHLVESLEDAMAFKRWLGERHENGAIAVDTETTGLDPREPGAGIRLIQFGDTMDGWALPWEDWRGLAMEALKEWDGLWVYHNLAFEHKWLVEHAPGGWRPYRDRSVDTMIAAHIIDPLGSGALKPLSTRYVHPKAAAGQNLLGDAMSKNGWGWGNVPVTFEPYWTYAAMDTILTARLWGVFRDRVADGGPYQGVFDLEMAVRFIASRMEERGARIDLDYSRTQLQLLEDEADAVEAWARRAFGIQIGSNAQLGRKIIELGGELLDTTATGKPKVDKYTLQVVMDPENGYPEGARVLAEQALRARTRRKFASTYFRNFVDKSYEGLLHADIRTLGARTGRMSISAPALQQVPKTSALVRNAFVPSDGCVLVTTDYSQIEMRIMAEISGDRDLQQAFRTADATGGDFFVEIGRQVYADPGFSKKDKRRGLIKNTMYGLAYGAGVSKMAESAGVPFARMDEVVRTLKSRYPGIGEFMHRTEQQGKLRAETEGQAYVVTPIGRRLPADEGRIYTLTNYQIQSSAADVLKQALVRLDAAGYHEWMVLPVHDEVVMDIPADLAEQAKNEVPTIMQEVEHAVPLTAESEGPFSRWGEKYL